VTRTTKLIVAVAAVAAVVAGYWMLVLAPKREEIAKLDADISTKQQELEAAKATLGTYRKDRTGYARNYSTLVRLGKAVPEQDDTRSLLVQLEDAADRSGVDFRTLSVGGGSGGTTAAAGAGASTIPGVTVGTAGFSVMPLTFSFRGSFFNMSQFFSRLEHFVTVRNSQIDVTGRLMRVESVSLKPDGLGFPSLRAEIGASTYILPESEGSTAGATQAGPSGTPAAQAATPAEGGTPPTTTATVPGVTP
jgi:hypothetical protein